MKRLSQPYIASATPRMVRMVGAVTLAASVCFGAAAHAQQAPPDDNASMVKPPQPAASGASAHNPDNMPIKRPQQPTNDKMMHAPPPASAAIAK